MAARNCEMAPSRSPTRRKRLPEGGLQIGFSFGERRADAGLFGGANGVA